MAEKTSAPGNTSGGYLAEFLDLYGKAVDALIARSKTQEPFSADLAGTIEPTLRSLASTKDTMLRTVRDELQKLPTEGRAAMDGQLRSVGAVDLLHAAIAAGQVPANDLAAPVRIVTMANGALRIPWLEIIKEILQVLLGLIKSLIPAWLYTLITELLRILDKFLEGMPHEDNAPAGI